MRIRTRTDTMNKVDCSFNFSVTPEINCSRSKPSRHCQILTIERNFERQDMFARPLPLLVSLAWTAVTLSGRGMQNNVLDMGSLGWRNTKFVRCGVESKQIDIVHRGSNFTCCVHLRRENLDLLGWHGADDEQMWFYNILFMFSSLLTKQERSINPIIICCDQSRWSEE